MNNYDKIKKLLKFDSEDDFYHLQIIKRKKDHSDLKSNSLVIKTYYIKSVEHLDTVLPEIISICNFHNARGCINLNRRSFEKIAYHMMQKIAGQIMNKDFKSVKDSYNSVCGAHLNETFKKWIVDFDEKDFIYGIRLEELKNTIEDIGGVIYETLETKSGFHLITGTFRLDLFKNTYPNIEVHKDNPTILYICNNTSN